MSRPEGTDGSDFAYREVIAARYKRMAAFMAVARIVVPLQLLPVLLKTCWHAVPYIVDGHSPAYYAYFLPVVSLVAFVAFMTGNIKKNVYLGNMKVTASALIILELVHFLNMYKYHSMDPKYTLYPRRLFKHLKDKGTISDMAWLDRFTLLEAVLDGAQFIAVLLAAVTMHWWLKDAMNIEKERKMRERAQGTGGPAFGAMPGKIKRK